MCACACVCVCAYLLEHESLLLLQQGLQLRRRQDLLHLLRSDHLRAHHGHGHGHLRTRHAGKAVICESTATTTRSTVRRCQTGAGGAFTPRHKNPIAARGVVSLFSFHSDVNHRRGRRQHRQEIKQTNTRLTFFSFFFLKRQFL